MTTPRVLLDEPLTFSLADRQTHAPMVHATVHGERTKAILDTGSTDHLLTVELAEQLGLELAEGEEGTDSTGASVPSWSLGDVPVEIGGMRFTLGNVVGIHGPAPRARKRPPSSLRRP
jgi:predicted aspartyl protease